MWQGATPYMDGVDSVTQCGTQPGQTFKYQFFTGNPNSAISKNQWGSYWYHSHSGGQYADGLFGGFVVRNWVNEQDFEVYQKLFNETIDEYVVILSETWVNRIFMFFKFFNWIFDVFFQTCH
jgi:FtsP/CotA-like multicopper oxidase with cupredoxin domain